MRSFRSLGFFRPPKAILVPGMYFLGFSRYLNWNTVSDISDCRRTLGNTNQGILVPDDALGLVGIGVGIALDLTGLATEEAEQRRTDLVAGTLFHGMTRVAAGLEELSTLLSVTCKRGQLTAIGTQWRITGEMDCDGARVERGR